MNTTQLAQLQDKIIGQLQIGEPVSPKDIKKLKKNLWVKVAEKMAPNNLVIRNLCILALTTGESWHYKRRIMNLIYKIRGADLWKEGYSYWRYTKTVLFMYAKFFDYISIKMFIESIDKEFQETAYRRNDGYLYPAPFGDVRNEPLEACLQNPSINCRRKGGVSWMWREFKNGFIYYHISPAPLGMNNHTPGEDQTIKIIEGFPYLRKYKVWVPYPFYQGYDKKYKNKWSMIKDTFLNPNRWGE